MWKKTCFIVALMAAAILINVTFSEVATSGGSMPAGFWSTGDRTKDGDRRSLGWKKLSTQVVVGSKTFPNWSPAVAANSKSTGVVWSSLHDGQVIGSIWDRATGTWTTGSGFNPPPLPAPPGKSAPALIARDGSLFDLVVLGNDQYYHAFHTGGKWSKWEPIGGMGGSPAITASKSGAMKLDVWVVAAGSIWRQRWQHATGWQGWKEIGHPPGVTLVVAPGAVVRPNNIIDIVAPDHHDGQLWHLWFSPSDIPSAWEKIPGRTFTQPALTSNGPDNLEVWVKGASDGSIFHETWAGGQWQDFEKTINNVPFGTSVNFSSGPAVSIADGTVTVAGMSMNREILVRSWAPTIPSTLTPATSVVTKRRPATSAGFIQETLAENSLTIAPACDAVYLSLGNAGDVQRQSLNCVMNGTGETLNGSFKTCESQASQSGMNFGSADNQVAVTKNGTVIYLRQAGGVMNETTRTDAGGNCRGTEKIFFATNCGAQWNGPVNLDPCDPNGPFDASFCNNDDATRPVASGSTKACPAGMPRTGTDRPEILASRHDGSVFVALGVAGSKGKYNLVLMRAKESSLTNWTVMDTELGSGAASSLSESETHLYLARCEYGSPANVGLYAYRKDQPFVAKNLVFLGNIADATCANGDVNISMMKNQAGFPVVRWVIPYMAGAQRVFKMGFSMVTPGGVVQLQSIEHKTPKMTALPTLVARDFDNRALLYWYELSGNDFWRVKGSISEGIGKWSPPFEISGMWPRAVVSPPPPAQLPPQPAPWGAWPAAGHDYMKGAALKTGTKTKFLAQWVQPVNGVNEIFYGIIE